MGILNAIEDAAGAVVEGAKDALGFGEQKQENEVVATANLEPTPTIENDEVAQVTEPTPTQTVRKYTVQAGDSLSKISKEFYGNSHDYMKIFEANRDVLSDPDRISVGQELVIPN